MKTGLKLIRRRVPTQMMSDALGVVALGVMLFGSLHISG